MSALYIGTLALAPKGLQGDTESLGGGHPYSGVPEAGLWPWDLEEHGWNW